MARDSFSVDLEWITETIVSQKGQEPNGNTITNDQIPITNEKDNDQFTNKKIEQTEGQDRLSHVWLFIIIN
jgi:hypothetical protein